MPDFRVIGNELTKRYHLAQQLKDQAAQRRLEQLKSMVARRTARRLFTAEQLHAREPPASSFKDELIFAQRSPNFCHRNAKWNTVGTSGRVCKSINIDSKKNETLAAEQDAESVAASCDYLCCGRGYFSQVVETVEECHCEFQWCCSVKCKKCTKRVIQYVCS
jgi:hypothetical protein